MPHFIELFFKYYSASFPFITYEDVVSSFLQSTLSPLLSNAIASLASRCVVALKLRARLLTIAQIQPNYGPACAC
jgi:hypothetical protein